MAERINNQLIYLADLEAGCIDLSSGQTLSKATGLADSIIYGFYPEKSAFTFVSGNNVWVYNYQTHEFKPLIMNIKFKDEKEYVTAARPVPDGWVILSDRNYYRLNSQGEILEHQYHKPESSFDLMKTLWTLGGYAAGAAFPDKMMEINRALYSERLIDGDEAWSNATAAAAYGDIGSSMVGGRMGSKAYESLYGNKEEKIAASSFLSNKWILADKLDKGQYGLRVINVEDGKEQQRIWLSQKSEFGYSLVPKLKGILVLRGNNRLQFYGIN
jgi:hypothetical protein